MTESEYETAAGRAATAGLSVPSFLALCGTGGAPTAEARAALIDLAGARRVLSGVASNLNQVTAKLHATRELDPRFAVLLDAVERIGARVEAAAGELARAGRFKQRTEGRCL